MVKTQTKRRGIGPNSSFLGRYYPSQFRRSRDSKYRLKRKGLRVFWKRFSFFVSTKKARRRVVRRNWALLQGILHVKSSFSNTHVNLTDLSGNTLVKVSGGSFKKELRVKKSSPFTNLLLGEEVTRRALRKGVRSVWLVVSGKGKGRGRRMVYRGLRKSKKLRFMFISVNPSLAHNGCRGRRPRRL